MSPAQCIVIARRIETIVRIVVCGAMKGTGWAGSTKRRQDEQDKNNNPAYPS
jgi:hypothetical protein